MAANTLDALVFRMAVDSVRGLRLGFAEKTAEIAVRSRGMLIFDVRIDGDADVQRVAAIRYSADQTGILTLDKEGFATRHFMVNGAFSSFIAPLENWTGLPLPMQATTDIAGHASLLIGALRNAGYLRRGQHP